VVFNFTRQRLELPGGGGRKEIEIKITIRIKIRIKIRIRIKIKIWRRGGGWRFVSWPCAKLEEFFAALQACDFALSIA
jgi:hypothetical protein